MKILIICPAIFPDAVIAAVRATMFAKYLSLFGHDVTVLRPGNVVNMAMGYNENRPFRVISYLGDDCDAERAERGEAIQIKQNVSPKSVSPRSDFHARLSEFYHWVVEPLAIRRDIQQAKKHFALQKKALDRLSSEHFDVVFSTYSPLEDVFAGEYASQLFKCKWVMDFRDLLVQTTTRSRLRNYVFNRIQKRALIKSDLCTAVSEGLSNALKESVKSAIVITLYNGYEPSSNGAQSVDERRGVFTICYTGNVYSRRAEALRELLIALHTLDSEHRIDKNKIRFVYAGGQIDKLLPMFEEFGLEEILENHGFVAPTEADELQRRSDVFLVLSWNTQQDRGILTGKFYEGIRAHKPMLAVVVGEMPNSELSLLNEKYHYGYCYEKALKEQSFRELCDYITMVYNEKIKNGIISYKQDKALEEDFRYDVITKQLETICFNLTK